MDTLRKLTYFFKQTRTFVITYKDLDRMNIPSLSWPSAESKTDSNNENIRDHNLRE